MDSHPMDEPFDELMGRPKRNLQTQDVYSSSLVTPDPSPTYSTSPATRSGAGPPSNAFVHTSAKDRWSQYEQDDRKLKEESDQAYATAVAAAAERAARRQSSYTTPSVDADPTMAENPDDEFAAPRHSTHSNPSAQMQFRRYKDNPEEDQGIEVSLQNAGASLPPPERRSAGRTGKAASPKEILKSLSRAAKLSGKSSAGRYEDRYEEEDVIFSDPHDKVRAEAIKVLEMADEKAHRSDDDSSSRKRVPAALSGLDFGSNSSARSPASSRKPYRDDRFAIDDDDDLVDVVEAERNSTGRAFDMEGGGSPKKSWSSRYSNPLPSHLATLTGGNRGSSASILDAYDKEHSRLAKNAQNFSPRQDSSSSSGGGVFGSGFSFRQKHVFGKQQSSSPSQYNLQNHRTVWMDVGNNSPSGHSLPPPTPARSWQSNLERKRLRRRRLCIVFFIAVTAAIIIGIVLGTKDNGGGDSGSFSLTGKGVGQTISFYVTANVPFDGADEVKLAGDLSAIPGDADFVTHLGNIQDASVTLCNQAVYDDVALVLEDSPVPMFMLPGPEDWSNCPDPAIGWDNWMENFDEFESNFNNHFTTDRQLGRTENFSFVHRGVLFIGLHLIGGRIHDQEEWTLRHEENVQWVEEKLNENKDSYRAVVLFGNARPSQQQHTFFREAVREIKDIGKPALYVHANGGGGLEEYKPFDDANNLWVVQSEDGGSSPPLRITVGFGSKPFQIGSSEEPDE